MGLAMRTRTLLLTTLALCTLAAWASSDSHAGEENLIPLPEDSNIEFVNELDVNDSPGSPIFDQDSEELAEVAKSEGSYMPYDVAEALRYSGEALKSEHPKKAHVGNHKKKVTKAPVKTKGPVKVANAHPVKITQKKPAKLHHG